MLGVCGGESPRPPWGLLAHQASVAGPLKALKPKPGTPLARMTEGGAIRSDLTSCSSFPRLKSGVPSSRALYGRSAGCASASQLTRPPD